MHRTIGLKMHLYQSLVENVSYTSVVFVLFYDMTRRLTEASNTSLPENTLSQTTIRWDTGDEKISSFAWGGAYAHRSSLDKYFSKISHKQNKS